MSNQWCILTRRYGADQRNPTGDQIAAAMAELYHETIPGMTEDDYAEHGAASLRYGEDDGPMFVLTVSRLREVSFEEWADLDFNEELAPPRTMRGVSESQACQLMAWLAQGQLDRLRAQLWE